MEIHFISKNFLSLSFICTSLVIFFSDSYSIAQQEPSLQTSCNSCCQGPSGTQGNPGIPGVPGTNGLAGSVGPKGDQGLRGESIKAERGEKGEIGGRGMKGDNGNPGLDGIIGFQGPAGKVGPRGIDGRPGSRGIDGRPGSVGLQGVPGVKGQKGEKPQTNLSAFSSSRSTPFTPSSNNQQLPFEHVHTNVGEDFDAAAGQFTCEIPGIYLFTYSIGYSTSNPHVHLMKNGVHINGLHRSQHTGHWDVSSNSAVLQLQAGDRVWLKCVYPRREIFSHTYKLTTFSGVLLHEV